ncbi:MAG: hypothetical protein OXH96_06260 [Spirochaetaceae bacterium]|nr:hypothetical protein [Spirochaetaceae bacterium]
MRGAPRLGIPNQTVKQLMYGYLRDAYRDLDVFPSTCTGSSSPAARSAARAESAEVFHGWEPAYFDAVA